MKDVIRFANDGGNVFGICNGFQILCESHLLPGALLRNSNQKFICKNVHLKTATTKRKITSLLDDKSLLKIPIAHADGRYFCDDDTLAELKENDQILFRYADADGYITPESNVNGSIDNIAGICNREGNVFGMMPHPERAAEARLGNEDGAWIIRSMLAEVLTTA